MQLSVFEANAGCLEAGLKMPGWETRPAARRWFAPFPQAECPHAAGFSTAQTGSQDRLKTTKTGKRGMTQSGWTVGTRIGFTLLALQILSKPGLYAGEIADWLSVNGVAAVIGMAQQAAGAPEADDTSRLVMPLQVEFDIHPLPRHEWFAKLAYTQGDGLTGNGTFVLAPWGGDHESDVRHINGRNRSYLLTAGCRFTHEWGENSASLTLGIIDSTDFLDGNELAGDEYARFFNEVFVFSGSHGLPSYDYGAAAEGRFGAWTFTGLLMDVGENEAGNSYLFWGAQVARAHENALGKGNLRIFLVGTDAKFPDVSETRLKCRVGGAVSATQQWGEQMGGFLRMGCQARSSRVNYQSFYSGGLNFPGATWGRKADTVGVACAYLHGGNTGVDHTHAVEAYYRCVITPGFALTGDIQYLYDARENAPRTRGVIGGIRAVVEF
jgi:porin